MSLQRHPRFGDLPECSYCERRSWRTILETDGPDRAIALFRCEACSRLATVYAPSDIDLVTTDEGVQTPETGILEFGGSFDV